MHYQQYNDVSKDLLLARCQSIIKTMQQLLQQTQRQKSDLSLQLQTTLQQLQNNKNFIQSLELKITRFEHQKIKSDYTISQLKGRIQNLQLENSQLAVNIQKEQIQKSTLNKEWNLTIKEINEKVKRHQEKSIRLQRCLQQQQQQTKKLKQSRIKQQQSNMKYLQKQLSNKQKTLQKLQSKIHELQKQNITLSQKYNLKTQYFSFDKNKNITHKISLLEQQNKSLQKQLQFKDRELLILQNQKQNYLLKMDRQRKHYHQLAKSLANNVINSPSFHTLSPIKSLQTSKTPAKKSILIQQNQQNNSSPLASSKKKRILNQAQRLQYLLERNIQYIKYDV